MQEAATALPQSVARSPGRPELAPDRIAVNPPAALRRRERICVLGIPLDLVTLSGAVEDIGEAAADRSRLFISTTNLNFLALSHRSKPFRDSLWASDLSTADGIAIVLLCRLLGIRIPQRVAGSDFAHAIAAAPSANFGGAVKVFFFGGTETAGPGACNAINNMNSPNLRCVGSLSPGFVTIEEMSTPAVIDAINQHDPDFVIVSLGAEKGQAWIIRNRASLKAPVVSHLGATINFLAGSVRRAPSAVQAMGLEWLWRIKEERHLASRYWTDGLFFAGLILQRVMPLAVWLRWNQWRYKDEDLAIEVSKPEPERITVTLGGAATRKAVENLERTLLGALASAPRVTIELGKLKWADLFAMATFQAAHEVASRNGVQLAFAGAKSGLGRGLSLNGLVNLLDD